MLGATHGCSDLRSSGGAKADAACEVVTEEKAPRVLAAAAMGEPFIREDKVAGVR